MQFTQQQPCQQRSFPTLNIQFGIKQQGFFMPTCFFCSGTSVGRTAPGRRDSLMTTVFYLIRAKRGDFFFVRGPGGGNLAVHLRHDPKILKSFFL